MELTQRHNDAADKLRVLYNNALADTAGNVNPVNLLCAIGVLAGQEFLKASLPGETLAALPEGQAVLSEPVSNGGPEFMSFLVWCCAQLKMEPPGEPEQPQHQEVYDWYMKAALTLERPIANVYEEFQIPVMERPYVVLLGAALMIAHAKDVLPPPKAQSFVLYAFVHGSKTVPYRDPKHKLGAPK